VASVEEVAERLSEIAEELAELALDRLRQASEAVRDLGAADQALIDEEKRLTRARRSVEKAESILRPAAAAED
jgi:DNA repair exonuclease SbcCD ATPase subunit